MRYFNDYKTFLLLQEKSDFGFSILDIFKPFKNIFNNINTKYKLNSIINDYDHYLYLVYKEYLERKYKESTKSDIDIDIKNISVVDSNNQAHIYTDIEDSETDSDSDSDSENTEPTPEPTLSEEERVSNKIEEIFGQVDPNFIFLAEELFELIDNNQILVLNKMLNIARARLESNTLKLQEEQNKNKEYVKMVRRYMNAMSSIDADTKLDPIKKRQEKEYNKKMLDSTNIKLNDSKNNIKKYEANIEETNINIEFIKKAILYASKNVNPNPPNPNKNYSASVDDPLNESKTWNQGTVYDMEWTPKDMNNINHLINPFQIQEYLLKAEYILDRIADKDDNGKDEKKYKNYWEQLLAKLYKKWYFTYDVKNLKTLSLSELNRDKDNKDKSKPKSEEVKSQKELAYYSLVLEELYKDIKTYPVPFKTLNIDKNKYFIWLNNTNMYLMKKIIFDNSYSFEIISKITSNDGKLIIGQLLNTDTNRMKLSLLSENVMSVYKEQNKFPIIIIKDNYLYSGQSLETMNKYLIKDTNIYSMKDYNVEKLKKDSNQPNLRLDKILDEDMFNKIKEKQSSLTY